MINVTAGNVMYQYVKKSTIAVTMRKMISKPMIKSTASIVFG